MLEAVSIGLPIVSFIFFYLAINSKGEWKYLQIMYLSVGFFFLIFNTALMGILATQIVITDMMFSLMWINILAMFVVVLFFILTFITGILKGLAGAHK